MIQYSGAFAINREAAAYWILRSMTALMNGPGDKEKREAAIAVGALDPGVPYESRWAPCDRIHGPGQGQFPEGSIRPRGYMAPDARRSFALWVDASEMSGGVG